MSEKGIWKGCNCAGCRRQWNSAKARPSSYKKWTKDKAHRDFRRRSKSAIKKENYEQIFIITEMKS